MEDKLNAAELMTKELSERINSLERFKELDPVKNKGQLVSLVTEIIFIGALLEALVDLTKGIKANVIEVQNIDEIK